MSSYTLFLLPFIAAFIGWFFSRIGIKLLFHPKEAKRFLGIRIQGVFPKRQQQLGYDLGVLVASDLFNLDDLTKKFADPRQLEHVKPFIAEHVDHFLDHKLKEKLPVISMFVGAGTMDKIKEGLLEEIDIMLPELMNQYVSKLKDNIDIGKIVSDKIAGISSGKMEQTLQKVMGKELRSVELMGAALGFLIGITQVLITLLIK